MPCTRRFISKPAAEPQKHRDTERNTEQGTANTKTRRHEGRAPIATCPQITQINTDGLLDAAVPRIAGGAAGDLTIAAPGGKPVCSERERSSQPFIPPADAPGARRFRLAPLLFLMGGAVHPPTGDEEWRGLRSSRAQAAGTGHCDERVRSERWPLPAVPGCRSTTAGTSARDRVSQQTICVYLCDLWVRWAMAFVSSCLRVCDDSVRSLCLCVSVVVRACE